MRKIIRFLILLVTSGSDPEVSTYKDGPCKLNSWAGWRKLPAGSDPAGSPDLR